MLCVEERPDGSLALVDPQPGDVGLCPMVLAAPGELAASPWNLSISEGEQLGGLILLVWVTAWIFRRLGDFFQWRNNDEAA